MVVREVGLVDFRITREREPLFVPNGSEMSLELPEGPCVLPDKSKTSLNTKGKKIVPSVEKAPLH